MRQDEVIWENSWETNRKQTMWWKQNPVKIKKYK